MVDLTRALAISEETEDLVLDDAIAGQASAPAPSPVSAPDVNSKLAAFEQIAASEDEPELEQGTDFDAFSEPAMEIGRNLLLTPLSGIVGLVAAPIVGVEKASKIIEDVQALGADLTAPETERGRQALKTVSNLFETGVEAVRTPVAGVSGAVQLAATGDPVAAEETIEEIQTEGIGPFFGDIVFDATGSPELATLTSVLPEATAEILGLKGAGRAAKASAPVVKETGQRISAGVDSILKNLLNEPEIQFIDETGKISEQGLAIIKELEDQGADISRLDREIASQLQGQDILTPEQAERFNLFQKRNVQPIRSQITQRGEDFIISQELAKGTNPVSEILATQDEALEAAAREGLENIGGTTNDIVETNANLFQTIDNVIGAAEELTNKAYKDAREKEIAARTVDQFGAATETKNVVNIQGLLDTLKNNKGKEKATGGLISSLETDLKNRGIIDKKGDFKSTGNIDVQTAEKIRQDINSHFEDATGQGKQLIRELKDQLDFDVEDAVGADIFQDARLAKIELERIKRKEKRDVRDRSKSTLMQDILDNKIPEEKIFEKIKNARDDEFLHIKDFMLNEAGPQGIQAWQNFKAQILSDAINKAIGTRAKTEGGGSSFKGNIFNKQFDSLRKSKRYKEIFNEAERELIEDIAEIDFLRNPKTGTISGKGPSAQAIQQLEDAKDSTTFQKVLRLLPVPGSSSAANALRNSAIRRAEKQVRKAEEGNVERQIDVTKETEAAAEELKKQQQKGNL